MVASDGSGEPHKGLRALIADQDGMTRAGMRHALSATGFEVVAEAADAAAAIDAARRSGPDACLIEAALPGDGLLAAGEISSSPGAPAILVLTDELVAEEMLRAIDAGANGYLPKGMQAGRLPHAVAGVCSGEAAVPRELVAQLMEEVRVRNRARSSPALRARGVSLTNREWEVMTQLDAGASTVEVATSLRLSPVTVRRHLGRALKKLGVEDREAGLALLRLG